MIMIRETYEIVLGGRHTEKRDKRKLLCYDG